MESLCHDTETFKVSVDVAINTDITMLDMDKLERKLEQKVKDVELDQAFTQID